MCHSMDWLGWYFVANCAFAIFGAGFAVGGRSAFKSMKRGW